VTDLYYEHRSPKCTCPSYKYATYQNNLGHKTCKHIKAVLKELGCGWSSLHSIPTSSGWEGGEPVCPKCGGPVKIVYVAV